MLRSGRRIEAAGQYMVEFGMTFIFFIFIILAVINFIILAYNFNLAQRTAWECARRAAVGASNNEIRDIIYSQFIEKMFASPFLQSRLAFDSRSFVVPNDQYDRVQSEQVTINLGFTSGIQFMLGSSITAKFPITSSLYVIAQNDADRDGRYDTTTSGIITQTGVAIDVYRDTLPYTDHDNDGLNDITLDLDDDGDGRLDSLDSGRIAFNFASSRYVLDTKISGAFAFNDVPIISNGRFCARIMSLRSDGQFDSGPRPIFPMQCPRDRYPSNGLISITTQIDLSHDRNNNGWDDKYENWVYR